MCLVVYRVHINTSSHAVLDRVREESNVVKDSTTFLCLLTQRRVHATPPPELVTRIEMRLLIAQLFGTIQLQICNVGGRLGDVGGRIGCTVVQGWA